PRQRLAAADAGHEQHRTLRRFDQIALFLPELNIHQRAHSSGTAFAAPLSAGGCARAGTTPYLSGPPDGGRDFSTAVRDAAPSVVSSSRESATMSFAPNSTT